MVLRQEIDEPQPGPQDPRKQVENEIRYGFTEPKDWDLPSGKLA